ncbi:MAG: radical SAM protein [Bacteroidales bacterium]|nr:radical SAM protein [Bacteroidales bacterium]
MKHTNKIHEIFISLQGEGFHTGTAAVFVRFSGCNLTCDFCDTLHQTFTLMSDEEIAETVSKYAVDWVILTGGEPSLQASDQLIDLLHRQGKKIAIETNGTHSLPRNLDWITVSPKIWDKTIVNQADELKIVFTGEDVEAWREKIKTNHWFLQPCSCKNTTETIQYILNHPHWRLSIQTHKYIGIE